MQDVELTRQADAARAAVVKGLHTGCRNSDGVGVVPMRLECACGEIDLGAFDPVRARSEPDRVRPPGGELVKTAGIGTPQRLRRGTKGYAPQCRGCVWCMALG